MRRVLGVVAALALVGCSHGEDPHPAGFVLTDCSAHLTVGCEPQPYSFPDDRCASGQAGYGTCRGGCYDCAACSWVYLVCR